MCPRLRLDFFEVLSKVPLSHNSDYNLLMIAGVFTYSVDLWLHI